MPKLKQKLVFFIEPDLGWTTPSKTGKSFLNRFAIEEDASFEIIQITEVSMTLSVHKTITDIAFEWSDTITGHDCHNFMIYIAMIHWPMNAYEIHQRYKNTGHG